MTNSTKPVQTSRGLYLVQAMGAPGESYRGWLVFTPTGEQIGAAGGYTYVEVAKNVARCHAMGIPLERAGRKGIRREG